MMVKILFMKIDDHVLLMENIGEYWWFMVIINGQYWWLMVKYIIFNGDSWGIFLRDFTMNTQYGYDLPFGYD
jgi:hypothetical protein